MKKMSWLLSLFISGSLFAQTKPVRELAPGIYFYFGDELQHKSANCLWVVFKDYVLVIDANYPWGALEIMQEIRKTTIKRVRFVFKYPLSSRSQLWQLCVC